MNTISYDLSGITAEKEKVFFCEMVSYISESIISSTRNGDIVEISYKDQNKRSDIIEKLEVLKKLATDKLIEGKESIDTKVIFDNKNAQTINSEPIFDYLIKTKSVIKVDSGLYAYSGLFLKLINYFYLKVRSVALEEFTAKEYTFPILFPVSSFKQGGYFETFPHHIMFQTTIKNDIEILNQFSNGGADKDQVLFENMKVPKNVIKNAACGPIYPSLENQKILSDSSPRTFFVKDKCFRNEASNVFELARLNEFSMAEIVFIGNEQETQTGIKKAMKLWYYWIETFGLNCSIETANDSFFAGNYKKLKMFQLLGNAKQEFRLLLPYCDTYIASSSVNFARTHFTKRYNITNENGYCHSSCIAFGLERLAYAFLAQNGCDPAKWSSMTIQEITKYVDLKDL